MPVSYDQDIVAWATEQAQLIRAGHFDKLDIEHIADEIEDVGKSEQRALASRMAVLITHLLKWGHQPAHRSASWSGSIREQRRRIQLALKRTPSLKNSLKDSRWLEEAWSEGLEKAMTETGLATFPRDPLWTAKQMLTKEWLPDGIATESSVHRFEMKTFANSTFSQGEYEDFRLKLPINSTSLERPSLIDNDGQKKVETESLESSKNRPRRG